MTNWGTTLSILIPTRNRHETLPFTLSTLRNSRTTDVEFVVCDNSDSPIDSVDFLSDSRFRFIRPSERLGMRENWDFCLREARGRFRCFIGDDDGVLPNSLDRLVAHLQQESSDVVVARSAGYEWPQFGKQPVLQLLRARQTSTDLRPRVLRELRAFRCSEFFPMPYNRATFSNSIELRIRSRTGGDFFTARTPDINAGASLALFASSIAFFDEVVFIAGASATSNGSLGKVGTFQQDFVKLSTYPFLSSLGDGLNTASQVQFIEPILRAMHSFGLVTEPSARRVIFRIFFSVPRVKESRLYCLRTWPELRLYIEILTCAAAAWHLLTWRIYLTKDIWRPLLFGDSEFIGFNPIHLSDVACASHTLQLFLDSPVPQDVDVLKFRIKSPRRLIHLLMTSLLAKWPTRSR